MTAFPEHWPPHIGDMWQDTTTDELWMCAATVEWVVDVPSPSTGMVSSLAPTTYWPVDDWYEKTEGHVVLVFRDGVKPTTAPTDVIALTHEYGVRYTAPGAPTITAAAADFDDALDQFDSLVSFGIVDAEIVSRLVHPWEISKSGLPDTIRALADFHADDAVTEETVRAKLRAWLPDRGKNPDSLLWPAWLELVKAVAEHRAADDEGRGEDVKRLDEEIRGLIAKVIGRPSR